MSGDERSDFLFKRINDIQNYKNVDILFIGSSHAGRGFDPRIFSTYGYTSFNLGSSSQTPIQSELLLKTYLKRLQPKLVVMEVFPILFESDGIEAEIDFRLNLSKIDRRFSSSISIFSNIKVINTTLYQTFNTYFPVEKTDAVTLKNTKDKYINGGYIETVRPFNKKSKPPFEHHKWVPRQNQKLAFDNIVGLLKTERIHL